MAIDSMYSQLITQFSEKMDAQAQQTVSRFYPYVDIVQMSGDDYMHNGLETIEARKVQGRVVPSQFDDITYNRRKMIRERFVVELPVDKSDVRGMMRDPQGDLARAIKAAMYRQVDRLIAQAAFATVQTGRYGDTSVTFVNDGGLTVNAISGLTFQQLLAISQNFIDNEVGIEQDEKLCLAITGTEHKELMKEVELTSRDFVSDMSIEKGRMIEALGMNLLLFGGGTDSVVSGVTNPILDVNSGVRDCIAFGSRGIKLGISKDIDVKIIEDPAYIETVKIQAVMEMGAIRTQGVRVQKIQTAA